MSLGFRVWAGATRLAGPALVLLLRRRLRAGRELADRLPERRGIDGSRRPEGRLVWLHAASVGETVSLLPLLGALRRADPALHLLLTTGTVSAQTLAQGRLAAELADISCDGGDGRLLLRFVPLDVPLWMRRFLDRWQPDLAVLVESELWPNLIAGCRGRGIPLVLLNARLSARSHAAWQRIGPLARPLFAAFAWISARSPEDADRLRALGGRAVAHDGDLKQAAEALPADMAELERLRRLVGGRPAWLAASTHPGEEAVVARLHAALAPRHPGLLTIVAPRHPGRGPGIAAELGGAPRRAADEDPPAGAGLWVCDTLGELGLLYRLCGTVLVGNSLDTGRPGGGGHNPLEPARLGCAIATGPLIGNIAAEMRRLEAAGALFVAADPPALLDWLDRMLSQPERRQAMADAARAVADASAGLPERLAGRLLALLPER